MPAERPDPVEILIESSKGRLEALLIAVIIFLSALVWRASHPRLAVLGCTPDSLQFGDVQRHPENNTLPGLLIVQPANGLKANAAGIREAIMAGVTTSTEPVKAVLLDLGATYHTGSVMDLDFNPDVIVECKGVGSAIDDSIQKVDASGIICLTGVGAGGATGKVVADMAAAAVLKNNVIFGSVIANKRYWYRAGENLKQADRKWLRRLITHCEKPENFKQALERQPDDIKVVI